MTIRFSAQCTLCRNYIFDPAELAAFQLRRRDDTDPDSKLVLTPVDLGGREPWSGVRCVCNECADTIAGLILGRRATRATNQP